MRTGRSGKAAAASLRTALGARRRHEAILAVVARPRLVRSRLRTGALPVLVAGDLGHGAEDLVGELRAVGAAGGWRGDAHDDLIGVELLELDVRCRARRPRDAIVEQRLDLG